MYFDYSINTILGVKKGDKMDFSDKTCDCTCVSYTEEEQETQKKSNILVDHRCMRYNKRLFHYDTHKGFNEMIYPCSECNFDNYKERV